jgi:two-component system sensor histidine kinase CpxA
MKRLFWKIFFSFWLAMILIVISVAWTQYVVNERYGDYRRVHEMLATQTEQVAEAIRINGIDPVRRALREADSGVDGRDRRGRFAQVFVFDQGRREILGRRSPPHVASMTDVTQPPDQRRSPPVHALTVTTPSGTPYRVVAFARVPPPRFLGADREGQLLRTGLAVLISALVCFVLARYLTRPVHRLSWAAREMAAGNLAARVGQPGEYSHDELGQMAREFDRMAGRLEQSIGLQRQLLVDVSHELRSPLARLQVATELARKRSGDSAAVELDRIEAEAERLNDLISELLHLSRQSDAERPLDRESVNLSELLGGIADDARMEAADSDRAVVLSCPDHLNVLANESLLARAIDNVVRNALRYTPDGGSVEVTARVAADGDILIEIADAGPGVASTDLDHIFRPFYRVGEARDRASGGFGLGLAIARTAIERHGGRIEAQNRASGGLRMCIKLPAESVDG